ncbi:Morn repeat incomplete domain containing protein [Pandoravirus quercus]|uniref:Morn repeat incomplete domain containing protein n=1 Tax=Pandoravirus quercus TaxID=2107709 RepID=A0A2U7U9G4_9VIRU|nr:Morn repeat incomplete domain containing protein [Pandoravirus quercus]AVK75083.1 Morn repeat incomplete domain containing protein [Pandoravirus quercus]
MASFLDGTGLARCPSDLLPVELWWAIVDALLSTRHGVLDVVTLGLVSRFLASMIFGDEGAWAFRCRRDLGADRVALHAERERFGVRWLQLYAASTVDIYCRGSDRPLRCGYESAPPFYRCGLYDSNHRVLYAFTAAQACPNAEIVGVTVMEHGHYPQGDSKTKWWLSMRRVSSPPFGGLDAYQRPEGTDIFCGCGECRRALGHPYRLYLGHLFASYLGGWGDEALPGGRGRAVFTNGAVYEGEWCDGVPHGQGTLDGVMFGWNRGTCLAHGRVCGCRVDGRTDCPCDGARGGAWSYEGQLVLWEGACVPLAIKPSVEASLRRWWSLIGQHGKVPHRPQPTDLNRDAQTAWAFPCGQGTATYADGTAYTGGWSNGEYTRGRLTLPDGTVFAGAMPGKWVRLGMGQITWSSGATTRCMTWHLPNRPAAVPRHGRGDDPHTNPDCRCAPLDPSVDVSLRPLHATIRMSNGDICVVKWSRSHQGVDGIASFTFSPTCSDTAFAGRTIPAGVAWTCVAVPRSGPRRPYCPDDWVYWPTDGDSDASALFDQYVRRRLIGWDDEAIEFWLNLRDQSVGATTSATL